MPNVTEAVVRLERPTMEEFKSEYLSGDRPIVITGALGEWKARNWTPENLAKRYPDFNCTIDGKAYKFGDFVERVLKSSDDLPAPYLRSLKIDKVLPELAAECTPTPEYWLPNWLAGPMSKPLDSRFDQGRPALFIGGLGGKFPYLHFDGAHTFTFISQLYGKKLFYFFRADQTKYLYVKDSRYNVSDIADVENVDPVKHPLFAQAKCSSCVLEPGDMLFMPPGLWHTTRMLSPSISIAVSRANHSNWASFTRDAITSVKLPLKPVVASYLGIMKVVRSMHGA